MVGLMQREFLDYPDLGYAVMPKFYRSGYAYAGCRELLKRARRKYHLSTVESFTNDVNTASKNLLEKLGFEDVGTFIHPQSGDELRRFQKRLKKNGRKCGRLGAKLRAWS